MKLWIVGGEPIVGRELEKAAHEAGHEAVRSEEPSPSEGESVVDLGPAPERWTPALEDLDAGRSAALAERVPRPVRIVRVSTIGAGPDAPSLLARAAGRAEDTLRTRDADTVVLRVGIVLGACGLVGAVRRHVESSRLVLVPGVARSKFEPLALEDLVAYCLEAATAPGSLGEIYDLGCGEILTGELLARGLADNLGVSRWILPVPALATPLAAALLGRRDFPGFAVASALEALRGGLLPRRMNAWEDFAHRPMELRDAMARAAGMVYPLRAPGEGRFANWRSPEKKGILWSKRRRP